MPERIVIATKNRDKIFEIEKLLSGLHMGIYTFDRFSDIPDVIEDGATLHENAIKKAKAFADYTGLTAVADDTGLEVDYLEGRPGVYSSRFAGADATYEDNIRKLLQDLESVPWAKRKARFRCVVAITNNRETETVEGICEGVITDHPKGEHGFGYDPVFLVPEHDSTFAEMTTELKNSISHRAKAFSSLRRLLESRSFNLQYQA